MNYVLFYPDELRAESLACYGHPLIKTPNYDRVAAEGTLFENAYTTHPVCAASRCSLVTGWYPHVQGYRSLRYLVDETKPNFLKYLREAGITTGLSAKNHCFTPKATEESFDTVVNFVRKVEDIYKGMHSKKGEKKYTMIAPPIPNENVAEEKDYRFVEEGIKFINECVEEDKPFFLQLSLLNPHPTYTALEDYYNMYNPEELPPLRDLSWLEGKPELYKLIRKYRESGEQEESIFKKMNAIYLGMISYTDMLLGKVINALEDKGIYNDTTIIICSDHGDFGGDVGLVEKWPSAMDDMLTKVPLIIRRPGEVGGHRVKELVQSIDIFPTVCDFEEIEIRHDQFGVSLRKQIEGEAGDDNRVVYCEGGYDTREPHCFEGLEGTKIAAILNREGGEYYPKLQQQQKDPKSVCRVVMQRDKKYKLNVRTNGENELYDMQNDPLEYHNLYNVPEFKEIRNELMQKMLTWMIHTSDVVPWKGHLE